MKYQLKQLNNEYTKQKKLDNKKNASCPTISQVDTCAYSDNEYVSMMDSLNSLYDSIDSLEMYEKFLVEEMLDN